MPPQVEEPKKEQEAPKSSGKKKLLIPIIALVLLTGAGAGAYFQFYRQAPESGEAKTKHEEVIIKDMDTLIVNLSDPGGKRFLKVAMKAKLDSNPANDEFTARSFEMRDTILMILSGKEFEDVARPEDKLRLKQELVAALNKTLKKGRVQDIYFTEFLIQ